MRIVKPLVIVEDEINTVHCLKKMEHFMRKCYKSEGKMTEDSYDPFLRDKIHNWKHTGVLEHRWCSVTFITDRGVSHEAVRHRMAAYLQESTRYCNYTKRGATFILPHATQPGHKDWPRFVADLKVAENTYNYWIGNGWTPQDARYFLPNGVKTEYAATLNFGSWYNFLVKRTSPAAHPQIRQLAIPLLRHFREKLPTIFDAIPIPEFPYEEARLVVNPNFDQIEFEDVPFESA